MSNYTRNDLTYISETAIDGTATGTTLVTQTLNDPDLPFHPLQASVTIISQANILTPCVISVGTNSPNYNNIVNAQTIGSAVGLKLLQVATNAPTIPYATDIKCVVNTAAIPVPLQPASLTFKVAVFGFDVEF